MKIATLIVCSSKCSRNGTRKPRLVNVSSAMRMAAAAAAAAAAAGGLYHAGDNSPGIQTAQM
jgi:hypothetical protein